MSQAPSSPVTEFRDFVGHIGGVSVVAKACKVAEFAVYQWWRRRYVPPAHTFALSRLASTAPVDVPPEAFESWFQKPPVSP